MYVYTLILFIFFFFFNDTATTEIYTLSLHDALPIYFFDRVIGQIFASKLLRFEPVNEFSDESFQLVFAAVGAFGRRDRKSTRLNSSHANISYAVFCLKKKKIA